MSSAAIIYGGRTGLIAVIFIMTQSRIMKLFYYTVAGNIVEQMSLYVMCEYHSSAGEGKEFWKII